MHAGVRVQAGVCRCAHLDVCGYAGMYTGVHVCVCVGACRCVCACRGVQVCTGAGSCLQLRGPPIPALVRLHLPVLILSPTAAVTHVFSPQVPP